jgi:hypothetical protein
MNYLAHGIRFLDRPYFLAGTCAPDWLSAMDRSVRLRTKSAAPFVEDADPRLAEFARGVVQHLEDDDWFHGTRGFAEVTGDLAAAFRKAIGSDHPTPCSFLGHIVMEMLLDAELVRRNPGVLEAYYEALSAVDPGVVEDSINRCAARGQTTRAREFIPLFIAERFLPDYVTTPGLSHRLNQVLRRVRLTPLPGEAHAALDVGRRLVADRFEDLLPPHLFSL